MDLYLTRMSSSWYPQNADEIFFFFSLSESKHRVHAQVTRWGGRCWTSLEGSELQGNPSGEVPGSGVDILSWLPGVCPSIPVGPAGPVAIPVRNWLALQVSSSRAESGVVKLNLQSTSPHSDSPIWSSTSNQADTHTHHWLGGRGKAKMTRFAAFIKIIPGLSFGLCPSSHATLTKGNWSQGELLSLQSKNQEFVPAQSSRRPFLHPGLWLHFWAFTQLREHQFSQTVDCEKPVSARGAQTPSIITTTSFSSRP